MHVKIDRTTKELCLFALPMLLGNILQSCYSMADMAIVGRFVGSEALAAISNTSMISFISGAICMGFTIGGTVLVARYRGAGDPDNQRNTIRTLFALSAIGGILLTVANYLLYQPVLQLMGIPGEALPYAVEYMHIVCAGNIFVFGYNAVCAVLRGLGDSRWPLVFVAITAGVNVVFDYLLVGVLGWGVRGAAIATVFAQACSCIAALLSLMHQSKRDSSFIFRYDRHTLRITPAICGQLLRIGIPTALRSAALNVSYLVVTALFNALGTASVAAAGIGLKVNTFVAMPAWAAGQAVSTMAGHSMGAGNPAQAARVARKGIKCGLLFTGAFLVLIHVFIRPFLGLFTPDSKVVELGILYLRLCCSVNFIPYVFMYVLDSFATGVGSPVLAMVNSLLHSVVIRLGLSLLLPLVLEDTFLALCIAESVSPLVPCIVGLTFFLMRRWQSSGGKPKQKKPKQAV